MKTIYKYSIQTTDSQSVSMPFDAEILCVQLQHGQPCLWAEVETDNTPEQRAIRIFGTGHEMPGEIGEYIGTYQLNHGALVFHVYNQKPRTYFIPARQ